MSENEEKEVKEETEEKEVKEETEEKEEKEKKETKKPLVYYSRIRVLLRGVYNGEETKLNVAGVAKEPLLGWLEALIKEASDCIVEAMPHKTKGEQEGQLARKTVKKADITKGKRVFRERYKEPKKKGKR